MIEVIGITGLKGAGKDTFARLIEKKLSPHIDRQRGDGIVLTSFASPIKEMVELITGYGEAYFEDNPEEKEKPVEWLGASHRKLWQTLGTQWGREMIHPDIWVNVAKEKFRQHGASCAFCCFRLIIFTDVRFDSEAQMIRELDGSVIEVVDAEREVSTAERIKRFLGLVHESEKGVSEGLTNTTVLNYKSDGTGELEKHADDAVKWLRKKHKKWLA